MLKVDPEFAAKIPPLTEEEFRQLEENILTEGRIITPIIVWGDVIVDGHNRYRIACTHPEIVYSTYQKDFPDRCSAIAWICKNQLGRRNLTPQQKKYLIGQRYEAEKMAHGGDRKSEEVKSSSQNEDLIPKGKTCDRIARENHVGHAYVARAADYAKGVDAAEETVPGTKEKLLSGELKVSEAAVSAIAKEAPERREEKVKEFSFVQKKRLPRINYPSVGRPWEPKPKAENKPPNMSLAAARRIGKSLETSDGITTLADVFMQLEDAAETMLDHWELCKSLNPDLFATKDCHTGIRKLTHELITYLKNFERGLSA